MTGSISVTGIVLATIPIGDYDKRLTILTRERGKITAFAKGARKINSALLACSQPFTFGEFTLYEGRTAYNIMSVEVKNYFAELREDITYVYYGLYFCEFADYMTRENNDELEIMKLLYQSLRALKNESIGVHLVRSIFEIKIIHLSGEGPQVFECIKCGAKEDTFRFSVETGGVICEQCKKSISDAKLITTSTLYTLQYIISSQVEKLYNFTVNDEVLGELRRIAEEYRNYHINHKMKALELLEIL